MPDKSGPAVKMVDIPDDYPSRRLAASFHTSNPGVVYALSEAAALEAQYEQLTREIKAGGSGLLAKAEALVAVEDQLAQRYYTINSAFDPATAQERSQQMLLETSLIAKKRAQGTGRQV